MVEPAAELSIMRQYELLSMSRGFFYYLPIELTERDFHLMEKLDELFTENPTRGTRRLRQALKKRCRLVAGRDAVRRLMRSMGITAMYPKKNLSVANPHTKNIRICSGGWPSPVQIRCGARTLPTCAYVKALCI